MRKIVALSFLSLNLVFGKGAIILDPAVVEIFYVLECEDKISAIAKTQQSEIWPKEKVEKLPSVGTYVKPSLEKIVELEPDLVIGSFHSGEIIDDLKRFKINYVETQANDLETIFENINLVGEYCKKEDASQKLIDEFKSKINSFDLSKIEGKKAVFFYASSNLMAFGKNTLPNDVFKTLKLDSIAEKLEGQTPMVSAEFLIEEDPDFMLVVSSGTVEEFLLQNPVLKHTKAAKSDKIIMVSSSSLLRGSPRLINEIESIYEKLIK
ncbi:MAG: ABC transporter substrate-binding protein [Campylobacteraceae bacterium]|nr:ABC transporter substrate-binding protein [Campylobacteraceae bacterium]